MSKRGIVVALAGNPNSGKTTVFNNLTGARQHVGNWPGVTVEKKEGKCPAGGCEIHVVDLPGVYSLTAYSPDEIVARNFIVEEKPDVVVDVVDASNLERNLYLAVQLMEIGAPLVVALNMMDQAEAREHRVDVAALSRELGVPVVPMIASQGRGTDELRDAIVAVADGAMVSKGAKLEYGREVEKEIAKLEEELKGMNLGGAYSARWVAIKLLEGDEEVERQLMEVANVRK
ncbi:MAG: FeoB small GTPase domain-containing protein [Chloroflexota bacterium]